MNRFYRFVCSGALLVTLLGSMPLKAAEVEGLYESEVVVAGQQPEQRAEALRRALAGVLVKLTGNRDAGRLPALQPLIERAPELAREYRYLRGAALRLSARFDAVQLSQALRATGVAVWGRARPSVVVWVAAEAEGQRELIGQEDEHIVRTALLSAAEQRGLPLLLPYLDTTDQVAIGVEHVWQEARERIVAASERYRPDAILVGRVLSPDGEQWQSTWTLYWLATAQTYRFANSDPGEAVAPVVHRLADAMAARYAQVLRDDDQTLVTIRASAIGGYSDYARVLRHLRGLSGVSQTQVVRVSADTAVFCLALRGQVDNLARVIELGGVLLPVAEISDEADLHYRLRP